MLVALGAVAFIVARKVANRRSPIATTALERPLIPAGMALDEETVDQEPDVVD